MQLILFMFFLYQLRSYLNEVLLDQMPVLADMQRYLEQLSMMEPPSSRRALILEQVRISNTFFLISKKIHIRDRALFFQ